MSEKKSDRALLAVAKANLKAAKWSIKETDEVFVNISLFNISQAAEKIVRFGDFPVDALRVDSVLIKSVGGGRVHKFCDYVLRIFRET